LHEFLLLIFDFQSACMKRTQSKTTASSRPWRTLRAKEITFPPRELPREPHASIPFQKLNARSTTVWRKTLPARPPIRPDLVDIGALANGSGYRAFEQGIARAMGIAHTTLRHHIENKSIRPDTENGRLPAVELFRKIAELGILKMDTSVPAVALLVRALILLLFCRAT
jgi:hypothetical protein